MLGKTQLKGRIIDPFGSDSGKFTFPKRTNGNLGKKLDEY
jgi:hypothetical protein